jgi:hypothetical protein
LTVGIGVGVGEGVTVSAAAAVLSKSQRHADIRSIILLPRRLMVSPLRQLAWLDSQHLICVPIRRLLQHQDSGYSRFLPASSLAKDLVCLWEREYRR